MNRGCPGPRSAGAPHRPVGGGETWTSKAPGEAVRGQVGDAGQTQMPVGCEGERGMEETKTEAPVTVPPHRLFGGTAGRGVWIASGDAHKVYADADGALTFRESFSRGEHETVFLEQACEWRPNPAGV